MKRAIPQSFIAGFIAVIALPVGFYMSGVAFSVERFTRISGVTVPSFLLAWAYLSIGERVAQRSGRLLKVFVIGFWCVFGSFLFWAFSPLLFITIDALLAGFTAGRIVGRGHTSIYEDLTVSLAAAFYTSHQIAKVGTGKARRAHADDEQRCDESAR